MLTRAILRSLCALLVGFLLVSNPSDMSSLFVQIIGGLFALSGILACIGYFTTHARESGFRTMFPIVGVGSLAFGVFLLIWPEQFINIFMYVLGGILCLVGLVQIISLISYRKFAPLTWSLFILPLLIIAAGILVVSYPMETASVPFTILGSAFIVYGVTEFIFGIRFYRCRRLFDAAQESQQAETEARDAEAVEIIEDGCSALQ